MKRAFAFFCPVHNMVERQECGLARTEYGREVVEERERARLTEPFPPKAEEPRPSPAYEQQYPDREQARLRRRVAELEAEIKRLRTPPPGLPEGNSARDLLP